MSENYTDIKDKLFKDRTIVICGPIDNAKATSIIFSLLTFDSESNDQIQLFISSLSGEYLDSLAIYDTIKRIKSPISATCIGFASGYAALILACCTKGRRYALKHSQITFEQPYGVINQGVNQETEIRISAKEALIEREAFEKLLSEHTGQPVEKIHKDLESGITLNAEEALAYGVIDKII